MFCGATAGPWKGHHAKRFRLSALALVLRSASRAVRRASSNPRLRAARRRLKRRPPELRRTGATPGAETRRGSRRGAGKGAGHHDDADGCAAGHRPGADARDGVSSETAKPDQPVRARVAKPVVVSGMEVIPVGRDSHRRCRVGRAIRTREGARIGRASLQRSDRDEHAVSDHHRAHLAPGRTRRRARTRRRLASARASARRSARLRAAKRAPRSAPASAAAPAPVRCSRRAAKK